MPKYHYQRPLLFVLVASLLLLIFAAYFAPQLMIAITNQIWALCGW